MTSSFDKEIENALVAIAILSLAPVLANAASKPIEQWATQHSFEHQAGG